MLEIFVIEKTAVRNLQVPKRSPIFETVRSTVCYILINENYIYTAAFTQKRIQCIFLGTIRRFMHYYSHGSAHAGGPDRMSDIDSGILRLLLYTSATLACISTRKIGPRLAASSRMIHIHLSVSLTFAAGSRIRRRRKFPFRAKNCILCVSHISALELHSLFFGGNGSRRSYPFKFMYVGNVISQAVSLMLNFNLKCSRAALERRSLGAKRLGKT